MKPDNTRSGWFLSHWRGETSLGISYWLNGLLLGGLLPNVVLIGYTLVNPLRHSLRANALAILLLIALQFGVWIWAIVGIIRSANRHTSRGGSLFWANAARVIICISVVSTVVRLDRTQIPEIRLMANLAAGRDPMNQVSVNVSSDGQSIILDGTLGEGSVDMVQRVIDASPDATTLVLNSNGGRGQEAEELALRVRQRRLNTYVQEQCLSACTYVFLAGTKRELADDAELGFHQPTAPALTSREQHELIQQMVEYYRSIGVREWFIDHIAATPPEELWYPTRSELVDAGVITR
jgi:membrane-bound ClpP family serine protease